MQQNSLSWVYYRPIHKLTCSCSHQKTGWL